MLEHVLTVACAVLEPSEQLDKLGRQPVNAGLECRLLARLLDRRVNLALRLLDHLLDARRMDASVGDQLLKRNARDLAAYRIESGKRDRLGRVVDYQIDSRESFYRADVSSLASDDASLHVLARERNDGNRGLRNVIRRASLYRQRYDIAGAALRLVLEIRLQLGKLHCLLVTYLRRELFHKLRFRLLGGHAGDLLKLFLLLCNKLFDAFVQFFVLAYLLCELLFLFLEIVTLAVERFFLCGNAAFLMGKLVASVLDFAVEVVLCLKDFFLRFDQSLFFLCFRCLNSVFKNFFSLFFRGTDFRLGNATAVSNSDKNTQRKRH